MKSVSAEIFLKRIGTSLGSLHLSTATQVQPNTKTHSFRTEENNVLNHTLDHVGQYYRIPNDEKKIYLYGGLPKSYQIQTTCAKNVFWYDFNLLSETVSRMFFSTFSQRLVLLQVFHRFLTMV
jgi:hypothetical protein